MKKAELEELKQRLSKLEEADRNKVIGFVINSDAHIIAINECVKEINNIKAFCLQLQDVINSMRKNIECPTK